MPMTMSAFMQRGARFEVIARQVSAAPHSDNSCYFFERVL